MVVYDIAGAKTTGGSTGCIGATVNSQTGSQPSSANASIISAPVITPDASGSVIIAVNQLGIGPPSGSLTPNVVFASIWATGMTDATNWDSGDCYGYIYTTSTNPISFDWQMANANGLPNGGSNYDGAAIEILPGAAATQNPTYSMTAAAATVSPGGSATSTVTVTSTSGYAGTVTFTCVVTAQPTGANDLPTCSASQTVTLSASTTSGTATVTVSTTAASSSDLVWPAAGKKWGKPSGGVVLALLAFLWIPARRRRWPSIFGVLLVATFLGSIAGCGGGGGSSAGGGGVINPGTTAGAYTITVTGTGSDAARTTATTTFTLMVT
jgi:hypothetical protein